MLYLLVALDGIFPPVPSESGVITMATLAAAGGHLQLVVILLVAAAGAFTGDQIAYSLGRRFNPRTLPLLRSARGVRTVDWAEATLTRRGPAVILAARFLPVARVAVNLTAGAVGYPRTGFTALTAISALTWSAYSGAIGLAAAAWFPDVPVVAVAVGVVGGLLVGLLVDGVLRLASPLRRRVVDRVGERRLHQRVQAGRRLVKHQEIRARRERRDERDLLGLPLA